MFSISAAPSRQSTRGSTRGVVHAAIAGAAMAMVVTFAASAAALTTEQALLVPPPSHDETSPMNNRSGTAVLAGGCFWGVQGVFQHVKGVTNVVSGYAGGDADTAQYETVSSGRTGHAESVRISFDPTKISYGRLLQIYFSVAHDPTELNRQGPDRGTQYRSTIFPVTTDQAQIARDYIAQINRTDTFGKPLATTVEPLQAFYPAESYHQDYLTLHPDQPYIAINDLPKVNNLKRLFRTVYRESPVLTGLAKTEQ